METAAELLPSRDRLASDERPVAVARPAAVAPATNGNGRGVEIRIENVRKEFGQFAALHSVSLDIRAGELIALLGPSGSGKTTLLRLIAGLEETTEGRILFGNEDASHRSVQDRNVGFVFQHYALFRHLSVAENIGFGLKVRRRSTRPARAEIRRRASELLDLVQLPGLERRFPTQLSGGQRQRVALARALAIDPAVLLLDEPFGALDAQVRRDLRRWLRDIHDRTGHTTVFVTHDQEEALELADRVVVLSQGRIEQVGSADELYDAPASPFVFSFIGESSAVPVTVAEGAAWFDGVRLPLTPVDVPAGPARLCLRPQDVDLIEPGARILTGKVLMVRRTGSGRRVEITIGEGGFRIEVEVPASTSPNIGDAVGLRLRRWRIYADQAG